jgi:hypothetical protein
MNFTALLIILNITLNFPEKKLVVELVSKSHKAMILALKRIIIKKILSKISLFFG